MGIKRFFSLSNIMSGIMTIFLVLMLVNPSVKAAVMQGLMKVGLFQPGVTEAETVEMEAAPDMAFSDGNGNSFTLSSLRGKVVFLNFWATWCPPCRAEMPSINTLYKKYKDDKNVVFLTVDTDGNYKKAKHFITKHKYDLPVYVADSRIPGELLGKSIPTTVIISKSGKVVYRQEGAADYGNDKFTDYFGQYIRK
ncbi:TlpA family protein disulfide reductase [Chitinophaga rhizophila]|uniref:TlpA family protein disulfide reductase n=1 Tax=Chitinophaga rhizophila TaxID=2866212 RepID=A0ABS7GLK0_9BACT|nr:TlpA disulfide reductase family protein [Chitinophaga rhizophila]MBW8687674.1 TlpA family protein disulfide reductase [Chitinophaga rhizophila]